MAKVKPYPEIISDWRETDLWDELKRRETTEAEDVKATLIKCMPDIQTILQKSATSPETFTLHDADHSGRVAQNMAWLMPNGLLHDLTNYELALLLLSAYLHDIGMTPEQKKIDDVYEYFVRGDKTVLDVDELDSFQNWLDTFPEEISVPVPQNSRDALIKARFILAYYCRFRHVEWANQWIRENLSGHTLEGYVCWQDDLQLLCASHHYDFEELKDTRFDPKPVGNQSEIVHLRYLAALLRIADILEIDPERTPEVIFQQRNIHEKSEIYWKKDHNITRSMDDDGCLSFFAEPANAQIYRAIELTIRDIESELQLVSRLDHETDFSHAKFQEPELPHHWHIKPYLRKTIREKDQSYQYIDGSFRPDTQKILQLLTGNSLYDSAFVAVRELLQNAFDAVRLQIAYERIEQSDSASLSVADKIGSLHKVEVSFVRDDSGYVLVCSDDGVGMTQDIIRDDLLVSGLTRRGNVRSLERQCKELGFEIGLTGQFGIGVLSYFLLAQKITIHTKRSQKPGDEDSEGWRFTTEGVGSFGELKKEKRNRNGTTVFLHLRDDEINAPDEWYENLVNYIKNTVAHLPCKLSVRSEVSGSVTTHFEKGWLRTPELLTRLALSHVLDSVKYDDSPASRIVPTSLQEKRDEIPRLRRELHLEMSQCLRWVTLPEFAVDEVGSCRIHIPVFDLPIGPSSVFLRTRNEGSVVVLDLLPDDIGRKESHATGSYGDMLVSWKGMNTQIHGDNTRGCIFHGAIAEIDYRDSTSAKLSISRESIEIPPEIIVRLNKIIYEAVDNTLQHLAVENAASPLAILNHVISGKGIPQKKGYLWSSNEERKGESRVTWSQIKFPAITFPTPEEKEIFNSSLQWRGKRVHHYGTFSVRFTYSGVGYLWCQNAAPDRVVAFSPEYQSMVAIPLWEKTPEKEIENHAKGFPCKYPPAWQNLCGTLGLGTPTWNKSHPLLQTTTPASFQWLSRFERLPIDPNEYADELLTDRTKCAAFFCNILSSRNLTFWSGLSEKQPTLLKELWDNVFSETKSSRVPLYFLFNHVQGSEGKITWSRELFTYSPDGCEKITNSSRIDELLPDPGEKWSIQIS